MDLTLHYYERIDIVTIVVATLLSLPGLIYLARSKNALSYHDWKILRAIFFVPLLVLLGAILISKTSSFGAIRLIYHVGATVYPLIAITILFIAFRRMTPSRQKLQV